MICCCPLKFNTLHVSLQFFWKSRSFPKEDQGLLPVGLAAGVTPTQEWHQLSEGVDDPEATYASAAGPWGSHGHVLTTSAGLTHWFKNTKGARTHPCLPHVYLLLQESSISVGKGWLHRSMLNPSCHHRGIILYHRAAKFSTNQRIALADPGLPTKQIKTPKLSENWPLMSVTSWGASPAEAGHGDTSPGSRAGSLTLTSKPRWLSHPISLGLCEIRSRKGWRAKAKHGAMSCPSAVDYVLVAAVSPLVLRILGIELVLPPCLAALTQNWVKITMPKPSL